jgi:hypothetical protein
LIVCVRTPLRNSPPQERLRIRLAQIGFFPALLHWSGRRAWWQLSWQLFVKFDNFGSFLRIGGSAGAGKGVLFYRERNSRVWNIRTSRVWNKREPGAIRGHWWRLRRAKRVGEGGLAGGMVRRRGCHRSGSGLGPGGARPVFLLGRGWLRVIRCGRGCGLLPATPSGGIDLRVDRCRG